MVVRTQCDGRTVTGLYIGARNARRHFSRKIKAVELQMDDIHVQCELPSRFWRDKPEIRDQRVCDWLSSRFFHGRSCRTPIPLAMIPAGENVFRLQPFRMLPESNGSARIGVAGALVHQLGVEIDCDATVCRVRQFVSCPVNEQLQNPLG